MGDSEEDLGVPFSQLLSISLEEGFLRTLKKADTNLVLWRSCWDKPGATKLQFLTPTRSSIYIKSDDALWWRIGLTQLVIERPLCQKRKLQLDSCDKSKMDNPPSAPIDPQGNPPVTGVILLGRGGGCRGRRCSGRGGCRGTGTPCDFELGHRE